MTNERSQVVGWGLTLILLLPLIAAMTAAITPLTHGLDSRAWWLLGQTILFAAVAAGVGVLAGYPVGRMGVAWSVVACVPMVLPSSLLGSAWIVALGRTGPSGEWLTVFDWPVAAAAVGLRYIGLAALIFATHRSSAGPAAQLFKLRHAWWWLGIKPAVMPAMIAFVVLFILCVADHILPSMFLIHTYGTQVLIQYNALQDLPGAAALASPMLLPAAVGAVVFCWAINNAPVQEQHQPQRRSIWLGSGVLSIAMGVPLAAIIWQAGSWTNYTSSFSMMRPEVWHTVKLSVFGSLLSIAFACPLAWCWLDRNRRGKGSVVPWILINLAAPPSLLALGLIDLSSRWPIVLLRDTDALLYAAYAVRFVPLAVLMMYVAGSRRPTLPVLAATVHGVPASRSLTRIHWPRWRGTIATAALLCGLLIATELEVSLLLTPAGTATVGVRLYTLIHTAPDTQVSAAALAMLSLLVLPIVVAGRLFTRRRA